MLPDHILQNDGTNIVSAALVLVGSVGGADEKVLSFLKVVSGGVVELLSAIGAEHQTRKRTALARCRSPMPLLSDFLHLVKDFLFDNRRMGVIENFMIFFGILPLLLIPNGIGVGFEIDSKMQSSVASRARRYPLCIFAVMLKHTWQAMHRGTHSCVLVGKHPKPFNNFVEIGYAPMELI